jgi:hypothetical protein
LRDAVRHLVVPKLPGFTARPPEIDADISSDDRVVDLISLRGVAMLEQEFLRLSLLVAGQGPYRPAGLDGRYSVKVLIVTGSVGACQR